MDFFVTDFGFAQHPRLELELHELFYPFSLNESFWAFLINGHAEFVFLSEKKRVLLRRKFEPKLSEQLTKLGCLLAR